MYEDISGLALGKCIELILIFYISSVNNEIVLHSEYFFYEEAAPPKKTCALHSRPTSGGPTFANMRFLNSCFKGV